MSLRTWWIKPHESITCLRGFIKSIGGVGTKEARQALAFVVEAGVGAVGDES
jgi:hypothetical protein